MAMPLVLIAVIGLVFFVVLTMLGGSRSPRVGHHRGRHASGWRRPFRFVGPVLGVALLVVLAFGTVDGVQREYDEPEAMSNELFDVPTTFLPDSPVVHQERAIAAAEAGEPISVVVHVVIADHHDWGLRPITGETFRFHGVPEHSGVVSMSREISGADLVVSLEVGRFVRRGESPKFVLEGHVAVDDFNISAHMGVSQSVEVGKLGEIATTFAGRNRGRFFSLNPNRQRKLVVLALPHIISDDDRGLTPIPIDALVASAGGYPKVRWEGLSGSGASSSVPGLDLALHLGKASLTLIAAALLLMTFFRHRALALAGIAMFVVLFVVSVDRWMVGVHRHRAQDAELEIATRCTAVELLGQSFFFRDTAKTVVGDLSRDPEAPERVRDAAREAHWRMDLR